MTDSASKTIAPYGSWISPFTSDFLVSGGVPLGGPLVAGADIYWLEGRPTEGGRQTLSHLAAYVIEIVRKQGED